jgi:hypothetical protein
LRKRRNSNNIIKAIKKSSSNKYKIKLLKMMSQEIEESVTEKKAESLVLKLIWNKKKACKNHLYWETKLPQI